MKKFVKRIALAVITLAVSLGIPAVMAGTASAAVTPVIYNYASGWNHADRQAPVGPYGPRRIAEGAHLVLERLELDHRQVDRDALGEQRRPELRAGQDELPQLYVTMSGVKYHDGRASTR